MRKYNVNMEKPLSAIKTMLQIFTILIAVRDIFTTKLLLSCEFVFINLLLHLICMFLLHFYITLLMYAVHLQCKNRFWWIYIPFTFSYLPHTFSYPFITTYCIEYGLEYHIITNVLRMITNLTILDRGRNGYLKETCGVQKICNWVQRRVERVCGGNARGPTCLLYTSRCV